MFLNFIAHHFVIAVLKFPFLLKKKKRSFAGNEIATVSFRRPRNKACKKKYTGRNTEDSLHAWFVAQSCPTYWDPIGCGPPGFCVRGIFQARVLERAAIAHSTVLSWPRDRTRVSCVSCIGRWILYH